LRPFARKAPKEEGEDVVENKEQHASDATDGIAGAKYQELSDSQFKNKVLSSNEAQMVYYTTLGRNDNVESEFKYFNKLIRTFRGVVNFSVFKMDSSSDGFSALAKKYKVASLSAGKPKLRYYPNQHSGENKFNRGYEIYFNKDSKDFSNIESEVQENYEHNVDDILANSFNSYIVRYAKDEQKNVVYYMYRDDQDVSLDYKAVSQHPMFSESSAFLSMRNPPVEIFQGLDTRLLPIIGVVKKLGPDFVDGHIQ